MSKRLRCVLISDFNVDTFSAHIENHPDAPDVEPVVESYGQVIPALMGAFAEDGRTRPEFAVIWTRPEAVIPSFNSLVEHQSVPLDGLLQEVETYGRQVLNFQKFVPNLLVPSWTLPPHAEGYGMLAMDNGIGILNALMRMNLRLSEVFDGSPNVHMLDAQKWITRAGRNAYGPKMWFMCKIPFGSHVFQSAARDVKSALRGMTGGAKKLIIVDLDDTLWGGTVGEAGWENLTLGGHHALGEAFREFQRALKALTHRGIILGIVSKNTESVALEAIANHSEMVLGIEDFAGWRINWEDKAQNIVDLVAELGIGLHSTVFIDDNPAERARVREALPEVTVPDWPENAVFYREALLELACFDSPSISREDVTRSQMYAAERGRKATRQNVDSVDEWLKTLNIVVDVEELNGGNLQRTAQLLNKTNQMNLRTRRLTEAELLSWLDRGHRKIWTFRVSDKFGDLGLTGIASLRINDGIGEIEDFVLSCRVIGRKIEETMMHAVVDYARSVRVDEIHANYLRTERNEPCLIWFKKSGLSHDAESDRFSWKTERPYPPPEGVTINVPLRHELRDSDVLHHEHD